LPFIGISAEITRITNRFNNPDNMHGDFIKVIIGSKAVSEGFSFKNVVFESINTPHWNYSETAQALARGIRLGSHNDLIRTGEKPSVTIFQPVSIPDFPEAESIDLLMYKTSEDKDISIRGILRLLMECAFDCALNYFRNVVDGKDGSRECDYTICDYKCDGVNMRAIKEGLQDKDLDYSTFQLYYANPKIPQIRKKIETLFRQNIKIDLQSIFKNLKNQFTEEEITNALFTLQEESEAGEFDYRDFLKFYSENSVKQIMNKVEELFREFFRLDLNTIIDFVGYKEFEVLTALRILINDNVVLTNKYGLKCYLREERNTFFLVNNMFVQSDFYIEYYSKFPQIVNKKDYQMVLEDIYTTSLPKVVEKICKTQNSQEFSKLLKNLPQDIQEFFIEASLVARDRRNKNPVKDKILDHFQGYIKEMENVWVSTLLPKLRCNEKGKDWRAWKDCDNAQKIKFLRLQESTTEKKKEDNPYGIMGKYNPENGSFCIVDFFKEKIIKENENKQADRRLNYSGKVCGAGGWKLPELINIMVHRLKVNPPEDFRDQETLEELKGEIEFAKISQGQDLSGFDKNTLRRILYWSLSKKDGGNKGIKPICEAMKRWFEENNLLEIDTQCGVQGKRKIMDIEEKESKKLFRIEAYVPLQNEENFKAYSKIITKLMKECLEVEKFKPVIDNNTWVLIFMKTKMIGCMMIDENKNLTNVCIGKTYRKPSVADEAIKEAMSVVQAIVRGNPSLVIESWRPKKLVDMYLSFGFEISKSDAKFTYMKFFSKK
jgi:hypothetical protein